MALQSDLGTALVFVAIFSGIVLLSGVSWKIIIPVFVTAVTGVAGFLAIFISKGGRAFLHQLGMPTYQINRILAWLNPFDFAQTTTYQQAQGQISTGLIMMLLFHIFENIGAVTGLLPLTGIPLPFISQGGSAIISNLIGVGLLLSMSYQTNLAEEKSGKVRFKRKKVVLKRIK